MNHIHKLQAEVRATKATLRTLEEGLSDLRNYLLSSKFSCGNELDGYVNVSDVFNRIAEARRAAYDVANEYEDIYHFAK